MVESARIRLFGSTIMPLVLSLVSLGSRGSNRKGLESFSIVLTLSIILLPSIIVIMVISNPDANAVTVNDDNVVEIDAKPPFRGADGEIKLTGVVHNTEGIPLEVMLGVNTTTTTTGNETETMVMEEAAPYSRVLYPYSVAPFKFSIKSIDLESHTTLTGIGRPFIISLEKLSTPNYDGLVVLNYTNIPFGENARSRRNRQKLSLHSSCGMLQSMHRPMMRTGHRSIL